MTSEEPEVTATARHAAAQRALTVGGPLLPVVLGMLTMFGPISMDLYLPVLPALGADLAAPASASQLTVTACLVGLAAGQLVAGPITDRYGRRGTLLIGVLAYIAASIGCALSPNVWVLVGARLVQGFAGAVGLVVASAAGRDLYTGAKLTRYYGHIVVLSGLAAIIGPLIGGQLATVTDWRGVFWFLAGIGALILAAVTTLFPETLPAQRRVTGRASETGSHLRILFRDRLFLGALLASSFVSAALFAYLAGATFVLQQIYGLTPQQYSYAFGLNSAGFAVTGWLAGRACHRWNERAVLAAGIGMVTLASLGLLAAALGQLPVAIVISSLLLLASGVAVTSPPSTALSLTDYPRIAGTAAATLGAARFAAGAAAAPLVGLAGATNMLPLGITTSAAAILAAASYATWIHKPRPDQGGLGARGEP